MTLFERCQLTRWTKPQGATFPSRHVLCSKIISGWTSYRRHERLCPRKQQQQQRRWGARTLQDKRSFKYRGACRRRALLVTIFR